MTAIGASDKPIVATWFDDPASSVNAVGLDETGDGGDLTAMAMDEFARAVRGMCKLLKEFEPAGEIRVDLQPRVLATEVPYWRR